MPTHMKPESVTYPGPAAPFSKQMPRDRLLNAKKVSSQEVLAALRAVGRGWTEDISSLLSIPASLFMIRTDSGTFFSKDERFTVMGLSGSLGPGGKLKAAPDEYGIALYSTGG